MTTANLMTPPQGPAGRLLPGWAKVLVVVAHPDDESFGLGAIISQMTATGSAVHILCYTHGEASTLNQNRATPPRPRPAERLRESHAAGQRRRALQQADGLPRPVFWQVSGGGGGI
jgi:LmbE family N-acetylglucosaminyl deacetylase